MNVAIAVKKNNGNGTQSVGEGCEQLGSQRRRIMRMVSPCAPMRRG